jgi:hypothetical protein
MLADEPIASLDPHNATKVMEALKLINEDVGITVISNLHHRHILRKTPAPDHWKGISGLSRPLTAVDLNNIYPLADRIRVLA